MTTFVPLLSREQVERLPQRAREVLEYSKSGLRVDCNRQAAHHVAADLLDHLATFFAPLKE